MWLLYITDYSPVTSNQVEYDESRPGLESITSLKNTLTLSEFDKEIGLKDL